MKSFRKKYGGITDITVKPRKPGRASEALTRGLPEVDTDLSAFRRKDRNCHLSPQSRKPSYGTLQQMSPCVRSTDMTQPPTVKGVSEINGFNSLASPAGWTQSEAKGHGRPRRCHVQGSAFRARDRAEQNKEWIGRCKHRITSIIQLFGKFQTIK